MKKLLFVLMAAGMLFACQSAQDKMSDAANAAKDAAGNVADAAGDAVADAAGDMVDAVSGSFDEIKGSLGDNAMSLAASSTMNWKGSKAVGGGHEGTVAFKDGMMSMNEAGISGVFTIDLASITSTDLTEATGAGKLIGHLASPDFFDVANNPTATLAFNNITVGEGGAFSGMARLDLKGKTSYNEVAGNISKTDAGTMANVTMNFDRTNHDIKYGSGKFFDDLGDKMINDQVNLNGTLMFN